MFSILLTISVATLFGVYGLRINIQPKYDKLNTERQKCLGNALRGRVENHGESNLDFDKLAKTIDDIWLENKYLILDVKESNFPSICKRSFILSILTLMAFFVDKYPSIAIPGWTLYSIAVLLGAFLVIIYSQLYREIDYYMKVKNIIK